MILKYDDNADGVVDASDAGFADILVWRDLDGDGKGEGYASEGEGGELFTLAELGITSLGATGEDLIPTTGDPEAGRELASGARLLAQGTYTREDGSLGNLYEAVFETDTTRTIYRGEGGLTPFAPLVQAGENAGNVVDATGRGRSTLLSIAASNDILLSDILKTQLAQMTTPDLVVLRQQSEAIISAWAAADPLSRELTPVLYSADGTQVLDYGIYVEVNGEGYWTLSSGAEIVDAQGVVISMPTLEDVLAQTSSQGSWQLEQLWSPHTRSEALEDRADAPYYGQVVDGRFVITDYGIKVEDINGSYWTLASGADILNAAGDVIERASLDDVLGQSVAAGFEWRVENITFDEVAALPFDTVGVFLVDGVATDFSVYVEDEDGGFYVWARNLARAIELQDIDGRAGTFSLRNYELDFDNLLDADNSDNSEYRTEVLSINQFRFATAIYGVEFQASILRATQDENGLLGYSVTNEVIAEVEDDVRDPDALSPIETAIQFMDLLIDIYVPVERGLAVRLGMQGGLAEVFDGLQYDITTDSFSPTTDLGLLPVLENVLETAPAPDPEAEIGDVDLRVAHLRDWKEILDVIYPDYENGDLTEAPLLKFIIAAYENTGFDLDIRQTARELGVDPSPIILHDELDEFVLGTGGRDYFYMTSGNQTYRGGGGKDFYYVGRDFGEDVIEDVEVRLQDARAGDTLWFAHVRSDQVYAYKDGIDLIIEVLGTDDRLTIRSQFEGVILDPLSRADISNNTEIVKIVFADGVVWEERDVALNTSHPLDSDDFVFGTPDYDVLDGGFGNDILQGLADSDIYVFGRGYGVDTVIDNNEDVFLRHNDILQFKDDIRAEHLFLERLGDSADLTIYLLDDEGNRTGDQVNVVGQFGQLSLPFFGTFYPNRIERLTFLDGSFLDENDIRVQVLENARTDGDDVIFGFGTDDVIDGGFGDDVLFGYNGDDTFVYGRDYGYDVVQERSTAFPVFGYPPADVDYIRFTDGLTAADFELVREGAESSTITFQVIGAEDRLTIKNQFKLTSTIIFGDYYFDGINFFLFDDGTVWDIYDVSRRLIDQQTTDGDDIVYGFELDDVLDGGLGNDRLEGGIYEDTYIFARGYGNDVIYDNSDERFLRAGFDTVVLRDLAVDDVELSREADDLILTIKDTGDSLRFESQWNRFEDNRVERFMFSDFIVSWRAFLPEDVDLIGTNAAETLIGTNYNELIDGRGGDDLLIGRSDGDTYIFNVGYGEDVIDERLQTPRWSTPDDTVRFGAELTIDNVIFSKSGNDLVVTVIDRSDTLTILGQFNGGGRDGIERFEFADGTVLTISDIEEVLAIEGGGRGDDYIEGIIDSENVLDGRQGDDTLIGGRLSDSYAFGVGYDLDTIEEQVDSIQDPEDGVVDRVVFGALVNPDELSVFRDENDLILSLDDTADELRIINGLSDQRIENFLFSDGTVWTIEDIRLRLLEGSSGADRLFGFNDRDDLLDGGAGPDDLRGGLGNDTYVFNLGYGSDSIADIGGVDKVIFGDLVTFENLAFSEDDGNVVIHFTTTDDTLVIRNVFRSGLNQNEAARIETLEFADGRVISFTQVVEALVAQLASAGDDVVRGSDGADTINGGAGDDLMTGGLGSDTYVYALGDGRDIIDDASYGYGHRDTLTLIDIGEQNISVRRADATSNDVILDIIGSTDQILIRNGLDLDGSSAIEIIEFANGVRWTIADLRDRALEASISDQADSVRGYDNSDDIIEAGRGDDFLSGGRGSDSYVFTRGDGADVIRDIGASANTDTLTINGYLLEELIFTRPDPSARDLLITFANTKDEILILDHFESTARGLELVDLGSGLSLNRDQISELVIGSGTDVGERLNGTSGDNTLIGRGGDDLLSGDDGSDSYIFERGDGQDVIDDNGNGDTDVIYLRGYELEDLIFERDAGHETSLVIRFVDSDDSISIVNMFSLSAADTIEQIVLDDGQILLAAEIIARATRGRETDGNDRLIGTTSSEYFSGRNGDDLISTGLIFIFMRVVMVLTSLMIMVSKIQIV